MHPTFLCFLVVFASWTRAQKVENNTITENKNAISDLVALRAEYDTKLQAELIFLKDEQEKNKICDANLISSYTTSNATSTELKQVQNEYETHKKANALLMKKLTASLLSVKELENTVTTLEKEASNRTISLLKLQGEMDTLILQHDSLNRSYTNAVEHLAHPLLIEYLNVRSKELGDMRPELKAALKKAQKAFSPHIHKAFQQGSHIYTTTKHQVEKNVGEYVGKDNSPVVTMSLLSLLLLLPAYLIYVFISRLRARIALKHVMMCLNFWGTCFFLAVFITSKTLAKKDEKMSLDLLHIIQNSNPTTYAVLQFSLFLFFMLHLVVSFQCYPLGQGLGHGHVALAASLTVCYHYYNAIFMPAMLDTKHSASCGIYLLYAGVYAYGSYTAMQLKNTKSSNCCEGKNRVVD